MSKLKSILSGLLIALPLASVSLLSGCASMNTCVTDRATVGSQQCASRCDNKITNSIISHLQSDSSLSGLPVVVSTCHHIVSLGGTVYNDAQLKTVLSIARHTPGVVLVRTGIMVRDPFVNH